MSCGQPTLRGKELRICEVAWRMISRPGIDRHFNLRTPALAGIHLVSTLLLFLFSFSFFHFHFPFLLAAEGSSPLLVCIAHSPYPQARSSPGFRRQGVDAQGLLEACVKKLERSRGPHGNLILGRIGLTDLFRHMAVGVWILGQVEGESSQRSSRRYRFRQSVYTLSPKYKTRNEPRLNEGG